MSRPPSDLAPRTGTGRSTALAVVLVVAAGIALWAALTETGFARADGALLGEAVDARTGPLNVLALTVTTVGNTVAHSLLASVLAVAAWRGGRRADAVLLVGVMAGAVLAFRGIKILIDRPRPPAATQVISETNESVPSGHATVSMAVIGSLVVLSWAGAARSHAGVLVAAAVLWVGAVGHARAA